MSLLLILRASQYASKLASSTLTAFENLNGISKRSWSTGKSAEAAAASGVPGCPSHPNRSLSLHLSALYPLQTFVFFLMGFAELRSILFSRSREPSFVFFFALLFLFLHCRDSMCTFSNYCFSLALPCHYLSTVCILARSKALFPVNLITALSCSFPLPQQYLF